MLESFLNLGSTEALNLNLSGILMVVLSSLALGLMVSQVYIKTHRKEGYAENFPVTLIMLPAIIAVIILLVGNNVARAFSLAGAFSLIRFRSAPGDPKDIAYVFFTLAVGLACGMGYLFYALIFALILCLVMIIIAKTRYGQSSTPKMNLKITIPEDMNYNHLFDETFTNYLHDWKLNKVKTSNFGSLFELFYTIVLKSSDSQKELIDELRSKNGNLNISLTINNTNGE